MVRLVLEEGRTIASVNKEYNLGEGTVRSWIRQFEEECEKNLEIKETKDIYEECVNKGYYQKNNIPYKKIMDSYNQLSKEII
jgi:transposase-like protein